MSSTAIWTRGKEVRWLTFVAGLMLAAGCGKTTDSPSGPTSVPIHLEFSSQPDRVFADSVLFPVISVEVKDPQGTLVTSSSYTIDLQLGANPGGATLSGEKSVRTLGGKASFTNLRVNKPGSGYTLRAAAEGSGTTASTTSSSFEVLAPPVLLDSTRLVLTSSAAQQSQGTYVFQVNGAAPTLTPGSVITGPQGGGYLRKVRTASQSGSTLTVTTDPAAISDVVRQGSLRMSSGLSLEGSAPPANVTWGPVSVVGLVPGVVVENGVISLDDVTLWSGNQGSLAITNGTISFEPEFRLEADFSLWRLQSMEVRVDGTVIFDADLQYGAWGALSAELPPLTLASIARPFFTTVGGWPVWGRVILSWELTGSVAANARATVQSGVTASAGITIGARYANGSWQSITEPHANLAVKPLTVTAEGGAHARVGAKAKVQVMLYDAIGPYLWAEPFVRGNVTADLLTNTWSSSCTSAINAGVGIQATILDYVLLDFNKSDDFMLTSWPICQHSGSLLPLRIEIAAGNNQSGRVRSALAAPLMVKVSSPVTGAPMSEIRVAFEVTEGDGSITPSEATSNAQGLAQTALALGSEVGLHQVRAAIVGSSGSGVTFSATATADGRLQGRVFHAVTGAGINGATVDIRNTAGTLVARVTSNASGEWVVFGLLAGGYRIDVASAGFVPTTIASQIVLSPLTVVEPIPLVPVSPVPGGISGTLIVATTGRPLVAPATVELRSGMNALSGTLVASVQTSTGSYQFASVPAGVYTVLALSNGYANGSRTGIIIGGGTIRTGQDVTLSGTGPGTSARIVLTWGATPSDLDSHLTGPVAGTSNRFWVYFFQQGACFAPPFACLDVDDTSAFGPETITIMQTASGSYRYYVYDYTNRHSPQSTMLGFSGAKVQVYIGASQVQTFFVPQGAGNAWAVFEWDGSVVRAVNQLFQISDVPRPAVRADTGTLSALIAELSNLISTQGVKRP